MRLGFVVAVVGDGFGGGWGEVVAVFPAGSKDNGFGVSGEVEAEAGAGGFSGLRLAG